MNQNKLETLKKIQSLDAQFNYVVASYAGDESAAVKQRIEVLQSRIGKLDAIVATASTQEATDAIYRVRALHLLHIADLERGCQNLTLTKSEMQEISETLDPVERFRLAGEAIRLRPPMRNEEL